MDSKTILRKLDEKYNQEENIKKQLIALQLQIEQIAEEKEALQNLYMLNENTAARREEAARGILSNDHLTQRIRREEPKKKSFIEKKLERKTTWDGS